MARRQLRDESGFVTLQYVAASALCVVVLVFVANLLVQVFTVAVVRDALDEAVRAGAPKHASTAVCAETANGALDGMLSPAVRGDIDVVCGETNGVVAARATVRLRSWLPGVPDRRVALEAYAVGER